MQTPEKDLCNGEPPSGWESTDVEVNRSIVYEPTPSNPVFYSPDAPGSDMPLPEAEMKGQNFWVAEAFRESIYPLYLEETNEKRPSSYQAVQRLPADSNLEEYVSSLPLTRYCQPPISTASLGVSEAAMVRPQASSGPNHAMPRLDDLLFNFDFSPETRPPKRKRKSFSAEERKKVHAVRKTHACVSCRSRKTSVCSLLTR